MTELPKDIAAGEGLIAFSVATTGDEIQALIYAAYEEIDTKFLEPSVIFVIGFPKPLSISIPAV